MAKILDNERAQEGSPVMVDNDLLLLMELVDSIATTLTLTTTTTTIHSTAKLKFVLYQLKNSQEKSYCCEEENNWILQPILLKIGKENLINTFERNTA